MTLQNLLKNEIKKTKLALKQNEARRLLKTQTHPYTLSWEDSIYFNDNRLKLLNDIYLYERTLDKYLKDKKRRLFLRTFKGAVDIDEIKKIDIRDFVKFNRSGFAPCIWHNEKTGSMKLYERENRVYCFGCHQKGSIIDVVMQLQGLNLSEALKVLSTK